MKIAIIGSGVSGLVSAYVLNEEHDVTVYESRDRIGGHVHTVEVNDHGIKRNVDTGFIVYNDWTYPNFIRLLERLKVDNIESEMSFSVHDEKTGLEYNGTTRNSLFAQRLNLIRPSFWKMIREILRFNENAPLHMTDGNQSLTLREYLQENQYSQNFIDHYIIPMGGAIWSSPNEIMYDFPASFFIRFFKNHGMLSIGERPTWRVVKGGSRAYVDALIKGFRNNIRVDAAVTKITRDADGVTVSTADGDDRYDQVVIATHSDQALRLLGDPTESEKSVLGVMKYVENDVVLHTDTAVLPKKKLAWAAWNAFLPATEKNKVSLTYSMNILQRLETETEYLVTLNDTVRIDPGKIIKRLTYYHPLYTLESVAAQERYNEIGGVNRTHYCGAYWYNGFHEDGVRSALRVCESILGPEGGKL